MTDLFTLPLPASFGRTASGTAWSRFGSGEPILLVHGVGMCQEFWAPQVHDLMADFEVITYDMWGHGRSIVDPDATTLSDFAHQLADLMAGLGLSSAHVVGHSLGALVAIQSAIEHAAAVRTLTALNAVFDRTSEQRAPVLRRAHALAADGAMDIDTTLLRWFDEPGTHPQAETLCRRLLESIDAAGYANAYLVFAEADQSAADVAGVRCPATFATGQDDPNSTPDMSRALASTVRGAQYRILRGQRHMMSLTVPHDVSQIIRDTVGQG